MIDKLHIFLTFSDLFSGRKHRRLDYPKPQVRRLGLNRVTQTWEHRLFSNLSEDKGFATKDVIKRSGDFHHTRRVLVPANLPNLVMDLLMSC